MKAKFFFGSRVCTLLVLFIGVGCTSSPRGAPVAQRASNAASDVLGAALHVTNPGTAGTRLPGGSDAAGELTRIEVYLSGLMACTSILPRQVNLEIRLGTDEGGPSVSFGTFSDASKLVLNARIVSGQSYLILLRSRVGSVLVQQL